MIVKYINGEKKIIANKSIIDHSQLSGKEAYGCHPISAIRKLPEKLYALQQKDIELEALIHTVDPQGVAELNEQMQEIETNASNISLTENDGLLTFKNYAGESTSFRSGNLVDDDTIQSENETISLKKVYVDDTISGIGTSESPLSINDFKSTITEQLTGINNDISAIENTLDTIDTDIETLESENATQSADIEILTTKVNAIQGIGGYLTANNFETATPDPSILFEYAKEELGLSQDSDIPNGTRIKNLFDNNLWILDNIPAENILAWVNDGQDTVEIANLNTAGIVKSSNELYEVAVNDTIGTMSVNGLENKLTSIDNEISFLNESALDSHNKLTTIYDPTDSRILIRDIILNNFSLNNTLTTLGNHVSELQTSIAGLQTDLDGKVEAEEQSNGNTTVIDNNGTDIEISFSSNSTVDNTFVLNKSGFEFIDNIAGENIRPKININEEMAYLSDISAKQDRLQLVSELQATDIIYGVTVNVKADNITYAKVSQFVETSSAFNVTLNTWFVSAQGLIFTKVNIVRDNATNPTVNALYYTYNGLPVQQPDINLEAKYLVTRV